VRKAAGIEFPGWDPSKSNLIAEAEMSEQPELGMRRDAVGSRHRRLEYDIRDGEWSTGMAGRCGLWSPSRASAHQRATLRDLSEALITVYGTDFGIHDPRGSRASPT